MRVILLFLTVMTLSSCAGHESLKAPCGPIAGWAGSPCAHAPINTMTVSLASL